MPQCESPLAHRTSPYQTSPDGGTFCPSTSYRFTVICYETDNLYGSELVPVPDPIPNSEPR